MTYEQIMAWIYENRKPGEYFMRTLVRLQHPVSNYLVAGTEALSDCQALEYALRLFNLEQNEPSNYLAAFLSQNGELTEEGVLVSLSREEFGRCRDKVLPYAFSMQTDVAKSIVHLKFDYQTNHEKSPVSRP